MAQVLAVQDEHRSAQIEQPALHRISQRALARARQAGEQHGRRLLAKALGALFGRYMGELAMVGGAAMGQRLSDDHTGAHGAIGQAINDNERASGAVAVVTVQGNRGIQGDLDLADLVQLQGTGRAFLEGVHIDLVDDARNRARHVAGGALDVVLLAR